MRSHHGDKIFRRMEQQAVTLGVSSEEVFEACIYPGNPRWRVDLHWIEFECGCRAERCMDLNFAKKWDPVIFRDLPEQAVYDYVCDFHSPEMNKFVGFGNFVDFKQWKFHRRNKLMGR